MMEPMCVLGCTVLCVFQQQKWLLYESWLCSGGVTVEEMSMHSWSCSAHMHTDTTCVGTHCVLDSKSSQVIYLDTVTWSITWKMMPIEQRPTDLRQCIQSQRVHFTQMQYNTKRQNHSQSQHILCLIYTVDTICLFGIF